MRNDETLDPTHDGEDLADLEQRRLDQLCDLLFDPDSVSSSSPALVGNAVAHKLDRSVQHIANSLPTMARPRRTTVRPAPHSRRPTTTTQNTSSKSASNRRATTLRSWLSTATLIAGCLLAAFCFYRGSTEPIQHTRVIEQVRPGQKVTVNAPAEALAADVARLNGLEVNWSGNDGGMRIAGIADPLRQLTDATPEQIAEADYRTVLLLGKEVWLNGTYNEINVATLQPWQWIHEHQVHVGGWAPMPLDTRELGLPDGMTGKVLDILPCPKIEPGPGRVVLTTINRLSDTVIELTLRSATEIEETLRPTGEHLFYSLTRGEWLPANDLQSGERLDGLTGPVTVTSSRPLPGIHRVYNFTVQGEHLYRVATSGVLVHNNYASKETQAAFEAAQEAWGKLPPDVRSMMHSINHGTRPLSDFTSLPAAQRQAILDYYRTTGANATKANAEAVRQLNQHRLDYLNGLRQDPPGGIGNFPKPGGGA